MSRVVVWYSDGAASAVAAKLALDKYGDRCVIVKCDTTNDEHPDNIRFREDVERWLGVPVELIRSERYTGVDDVFEKRRYMAGVAGAICTTELKKMVREAYQREDDIHVFGYTVEEHLRAKRFEQNNPDIQCDWVLIDQFVRKQDCHRMLREAGIKRPAMYDLGFEHNNCIGCVKAASPGYWQKVRDNFPDVFERRAAQARDIGARLVKIEGERKFLDELPEDYGRQESDGDIDCGPFCQWDLLDGFEEEK
jgi:PP-loop superfamily ATP-utilizing enzyme